MKVYDLIDFIPSIGLYTGLRRQSKIFRERFRDEMLRGRVKDTADAFTTSLQITGELGVNNFVGYHAIIIGASLTTALYLLSK